MTTAVSSFGRTQESNAPQYPPAPAASAVETKPRRRRKRKPDVMRRVWVEFRRNPSETLHQQLVTYYMNTHVRRLAERMHARLPNQVDVEDLVQEGYLGLIDSIRRFDPERNIKFETFSGQRINGAMRDYLRRIDPAPRLARSRERELQVIIEQFRKAHGRAPSEQEIYERMDLPEDIFRTFMNVGRTPMTVHFNAARPDGEESDDSDGMRGFEDHRHQTPHNRAEHDDLRRWVSAGLDRRDRLILTLYFYERMTMKEVGRTLGISESRVSQLLDEIIQCVKAKAGYAGAEEEFFFRD